MTEQHDSGGGRLGSRNQWTRRCARRASAAGGGGGGARGIFTVARPRQTRRAEEGGTDFFHFYIVSNGKLNATPPLPLSYPQVQEGATYALGAVEGAAAAKRATDSTRVERLRQVREQERLWARFKAKEYRAAVADHHAELTHQLHEAGGC